MSALTHAKNFRELIVYQKSRELAREIFALTVKFPKEEMFSLTDQIRRFSRAIGAQIADCGYLSQPQVAALKERCAELGRLLGGMMAKAELFCNPEALSVREEQASYFTDN